MSYFLKRYAAALRRYWPWMLLALVPAALYLVVAAVTDVNYEVVQEFDAYSPDTPIAAANSPLATLKLGRVVADPNLLLLDGAALAQLQNRLRLTGGYGRLLDEATLHRRVNEGLSLAEDGKGRLRLHYTGSDPELGRTLVAFYGERLLKRIAEGTSRARGTDTGGPPPLTPAAAATVTAERSAWRPGRLTPTLGVLLLSTLAALGLIAWFDLSDPSFRSERLIARYLGVPVLGVLPDATPLTRTLPD